MRKSMWCKAGAVAALLVLSASPASAQVIGGPWSGEYTLADLGSVPGLPGSYGGVVFARNDPARLLIGGDSNTSIGAVYSISVQRDASGHVVGFQGNAARLADAPFIDGGLAYAPNGVLLYTAFPINFLGQIRPGATGPSKTTYLSGLGVGGSVGGVRVVEGASGGTRLKLTSPGVSRWYDAPLVPDGLGTYNVGLATPRGPTAPSAGSMVFVDAGQPGFAVDTALVASCNGFVGAYSLDANRDIVLNIGSFVLAIPGCVDGMTVDPLTGDLVLAIWDLRRIYVVRGFTGTATYCEGSTAGACTPQIGWSGTPTLSGADDFVVRATDLQPNRSALEAWSSRPAQFPYAGAFLCLAQPIRRIALVSSGASSSCGGVLSHAWTHAYFAANGLGAGSTVYTQFLVRNSGASAGPAVLTSDALRFTVAP